MTAAHQVGLVCEGASDRRTVTQLADRVVESRIDWFTGDTADSLRCWSGLSGADFLAWKSVKTEARGYGLEGPRVWGRFSGEPGAPDSRAARLALLLMNTLDPTPAAVILVRDSDGDPRRRIGLEQARAAGRWPFAVIVGVAEPERECWYIANFVAKDERERSRLALQTEAVGFDPCARPAELGGPDREPKKILHALAEGDLDREAECLTLPLETLAERGSTIGLTQFLKELEDQLVPVFGIDPVPRDRVTH